MFAGAFVAVFAGFAAVVVEAFVLVETLKLQPTIPNPNAEITIIVKSVFFILFIFFFNFEL